VPSEFIIIIIIIIVVIIIIIIIIIIILLTTFLLFKNFAFPTKTEKEKHTSTKQTPNTFRQVELALQSGSAVAAEFGGRVDASAAAAAVLSA